MHIASAIFHRSCPDLESCPDESLPEFAFIGRSNVGKSSLLNMLSGKPELAKVSPTPGFTKLINIFTMNKNWRLVDLPGYGYAKVARADKSQFNQAVMDYLEHRANLCLVFALIDSGLEPQDIDVEFIEWLAHNEVPSSSSSPRPTVFPKQPCRPTSPPSPRASGNGSRNYRQYSPVPPRPAMAARNCSALSMSN